MPENFVCRSANAKYYYKSSHLIKLGHEWIPHWLSCQSMKKEDQRRTCWSQFKIQGVLQKFCLNFHKMNRCLCLLEPVAIIPLFPNGIHKIVPWKKKLAVLCSLRLYGKSGAEQPTQLIIISEQILKDVITTTITFQQGLYYDDEDLYGSNDSDTEVKMTEGRRKPKPLPPDKINMTMVNHYCTLSSRNVSIKTYSLVVLVFADFCHTYI